MRKRETKQVRGEQREGERDHRFFFLLVGQHCRLGFRNQTFACVFMSAVLDVYDGEVSACRRMVRPKAEPPSLSCLPVGSSQELSQLFRAC